MKRYTYISVLVTLALIVLTSCVRDDTDAVNRFTGKGELAEISFLVSAPVTNQVNTCAGGTVPENTINDIYVLVFDKSTGNLVSKSKGKNLNVAAGAQNNNKVTFKATLPVGAEYTFMVLANLEGELNGIDVGMSPSKKKSDVLALTIGSTDRWDHVSPDIPMWAEKDLNLTASATPSFELARMLARVNVAVDLRDGDNFELTSVRYYNYNTRGAVVPPRENFDFATNTTLAPTIPATPGTQLGSSLLYDNSSLNSDIDDGMVCQEKIYVFEAAHNGNTYNSPANNTGWINNPCLVIGGIFTTPDGTKLTETFYRVDFIKKDNTVPGNPQDRWLSILRNYSYNVTIVEVSGSGFEDPETALRSAPINMEANILEWYEKDMGNIVFDGVFFLSVSRDHLTVVSSAVHEEKQENLLYIKTDYIFGNDPASDKSGWYVEKYVDKDTGDPATWLTLNPDRAPADPDNPVKTYFTFEENDTGAARTAIVWIAAGRLRYPVEVTQKLAWISIVDPDNGDAPLDELRFEVPFGGSSEQIKKFKVLWGPSGQIVGIGQQSPREWAPFTSDRLDPDPDFSSWQLTGNGSQEYTVTAPPVDMALVEQDPFYERESVYSFTVGTGDQAETASITLHQIYYNILVDVYRYKLDGSTYSLTVRSNTEWVITDIEEWLYNKPPEETRPKPVMLDLKGSDNLREQTRGGPNISGEAVSFTVVDHAIETHKSKWGTVWVTFTSPDNKFAPLRVAIPFPARKVTILGLGYSLVDRCFNPAYPSPSHRQGTNRLLTAEVNFGNAAESTFKVEGLNIIGYNCQGSSVGSGGNPENTPVWQKGFLKYWINTYNPDVIIITYSMILDDDESKLIVKYLENGGSVLMFYGADTPTGEQSRNFLQVLFGMTMTAGVDPNLPGTRILHKANRPASGAVYKYSNVDDPVLNGPFLNVRDKYCGIHGLRLGIRTSLIQDKVHILASMDYEYTYSTSDHAGFTLAFRHKDYNLVFMGNGMGTGGYYLGTIYDWYDPLRIDSEFKPIPRPNFRANDWDSPKFEVYNSYFFANAVAWAITESDHRMPDEGY